LNTSLSLAVVAAQAGTEQIMVVAVAELVGIALTQQAKQAEAHRAPKQH
jgi:hypothetical protein